MVDLVKHQSSTPTKVALYDIYLAGRLSENSKRTMSQALMRAASIATGHEPTEDLARGFRWQNLRANEIEAIQARLASTVSVSTANLTIAAIKGVMKVARRERQISIDDLRDIEDIRPLPESDKPLRGRALTDEELTKLALTCREDLTPAGTRDAALMTVAYGAGLRRAEIAALILSDWNKDEASLLVRRGKGRKDRIVYLSPSGARTLTRWLDLRSAPGADASIFTPINKGGRIVERAMTPMAIYNAFNKRALSAGIPHFSPHDMRRSFISDLLDSNSDISVVAKLAGHSNVTVTQRYDRRGEQAKKAAAARLRVPF